MTVIARRRLLPQVDSMDVAPVFVSIHAIEHSMPMWSWAELCDGHLLSQLRATKIFMRTRLCMKGSRYSSVFVYTRNVSFGRKYKDNRRCNA